MRTLETSGPHPRIHPKAVQKAAKRLFDCLSQGTGRTVGEIVGIRPGEESRPIATRKAGELAQRKPFAFSMLARHCSVDHIQCRCFSFPSMPARSCRVTIQDMDGVSHTVEVSASSLFEAVAQGLAALRTDDWVAGIPQGMNVVKVAVCDIRVEHEVS